MVYVVAQQTYLRDRIAPVSNHVAEVQNGEALRVVEHDRRFFKVKTSGGQVGWIEEHLVIDQPTYEQFVLLGEQHRRDPVVATGVLRDNFYLHLRPGKETERFYLAPENDHLQLLVRTSIPKPNAAAEATPPSGAAPRVKRSSPHPERRSGSIIADAPSIPMEDWWLVRDSKGQVGWLMARRLDVDVPDEIGGYAEGQKMVGAYVLTKVFDPGSNFPDKQAPIYIAVSNPYMDGLPYDFNQVRVFTWNTKKHRYETAFRERGLEGYLPVEISQEKIDTIDRGAPVPVFTLHVANNEAAPEPSSQASPQPVPKEILRFALEGSIVKKIFPAPQQNSAKLAERRTPPNRTTERHVRAR